MDWNNFKNGVVTYVEGNRSGNIGEYRMCEGGNVTLYSSCFALMTLFYCDSLQKYSREDLCIWGNYINRWQDKKSGLFIGPEVVEEELTSPLHDFEHISMHLTAHVLPCLALLGMGTGFPIYFAHSYLSKNELTKWLGKRDWGNAWFEGNNIFLVLQFLIWLRDVEKIKDASQSLNIIFDWLDSELDPETGLWGTNGFCSPHEAMYGGYHQLLAYYYENRDLKYTQALIDTVLSLQNIDGGFYPKGGGGGCEDVDAADILVNLYKRIDYRRHDIEFCVRRLLKSVLKRQIQNGGFVYRLNSQFIYMGIKGTKSPPNFSNMFATWFGVHTIALISEVLPDIFHGNQMFQFNNSFSMGWHKKWEKEDVTIPTYKKIKSTINGYTHLGVCWVGIKMHSILRKFKRIIGSLS